MLLKFTEKFKNLFLLCNDSLFFFGTGIHQIFLFQKYKQVLFALPRPVVLMKFSSRCFFVMQISILSSSWFKFVVMALNKTHNFTLGE